ncbi:MAG: hypothetical protein CMJ59_00060, partial [Planctomycetaceae bacterium]|nr:hypothetical protein [Planctomycetaceae bacterium]
MIRCLMLVALTALLALPTRAAEPHAARVPVLLATALAPPEPAGMRTIFNGKDLSGWDGDPRLWSVQDGAIHGETTAENRANGNTFILWKEGTTKDFELRLSFRCN